MDIWNHTSSGGASSISKPLLDFSNTVMEKAHFEQQGRVRVNEKKIDVDHRELYFLIMHFLSSGPFHRTFRQFQDEVLGHELLPRRYHAWFSRCDAHSGNDNDDGVSLPLSYDKLVERYPHVEKDHLVKLLKQMLLNTDSMLGKAGGNTLNAAHVPTILGSGSFSLLDCERSMHKQAKPLPANLRWPHMQIDQVHGLSLREIGGGFAKHHRAPSIRYASYAIAKPLTMVQKMQNTKRLRGHRTAVYCAIFDRSGRYVITGSDDRLVKIWSMETAFCLASCRGHEGDITDLAVSSNNALVASASNDFFIRVWRLPDGVPISVLQGHTGAVTAIAFSPRLGSVYHLLSSSDDGTCRVWDARYSHCSPRIYVPKPSDALAGKSSGTFSNGPSSSNGPQRNQILCCAYNANGTAFVTGSSDTYARVWNACKSNTDESEQPIHEMDVLSGHENDVNYVQFSGCAVAPRSSMSDALKEDSVPKFKTSWFCHDKIVTCSRDGSAIIWRPISRRSHGKSVRWTMSYHLKVPPPPLPPQPLRGGPRQRILPTPRGVNMIVWSLDKRFVLAAVMDCRICVWNAADSCLVHSLTGHTESSYVLDVHPFNPRIAMSAGYDGRLIVWDIWEGIPIRTYEIGHVKLVDGKFSPDGTSVVLSDDVGQIYLLNTGQGESQKDAKYDQFFLGDYRPLTHDAAGNALDQETQLPPHRRNIEDPLCDSSMIPYAEPYQTMFQQRRLGALGVEWRPSSIKYFVGPDIGLGQDYQMPPLEDLDRMLEPLPDFIDAIYWEPENEVISDNTDSEYNVAEECTSEEEQGSLCFSSPSDPNCSTGDSDAENSKKDSIRRSRRRKHKTEAEQMTSSGRRLKKRNMDERDSSLSGSNGGKKLKGVKKAKRKSSKAKSSRPQRVAARNARNMLSKITGTSTDEDDEDVSEDDTSNCESGLQDLTVQNNRGDGYLHNAEEKCTREDKLVLVEDMARPPELLESQSVLGNRKKIVLKFSLRDSKKPMSPESRLNGENHIFSVDPSSGPIEENNIKLSSEDLGASSSNVSGFGLSQYHTRGDLTGASTASSNEICNVGDKNWSRSDKHSCCDPVDISEVFGANHSQELKVDPPPKITRLKIKTKSILKDSRTVGDLTSNGGDVMSETPSCLGQDKISGVPDRGGEGLGRSISLYDVNKRERTHKARSDLEGFDSAIKENPSPANDHCGSGIDLSEAENGDAICRTRSMKMKATQREPNAQNHSLGVKMGHELVGTSKNAAGDEFLSEEWMSSSKMTVRSRSVKNKKGKYSDNDTRLIRRESNQPIRKLSWLSLSKHEDGYRYIPQLGDEVVYLRQGHQEYIDLYSLREKGPWSLIKGCLGAVEICKVEDLDYAIVPGSGDSCCKITLRFVDATSVAFGKAFKLTLPELIDFPDFVVEKTRYDASINRDWTSKDRCEVWWRNENGEGGEWWEGEIVSVQAKSVDFPDSPWERYEVIYTSDPTLHKHSPWELHDLGIPWEHPHIDFDTTNRLLSLFTKLELSANKNQDSCGIQKLNEASHKWDFFNRAAFVGVDVEILQMIFGFCGSFADSQYLSVLKLSSQG
ncbi:hypothetical protein DKX38_021218 [Salix brachista]|uniref:LisH domain-containing protein n=1 Tax=Salix brachista TaxID=2182728 RepID=A0A5N5K779_9ROSI|nr:hypothetical protein DKX38_021218 [Salix brachista]